MTYLEKQFWCAHARAMRAQAEIISGAYKLRNVQKGCEKTTENPTGWRELTEEEKLKEKVAEMNRHIERMQEITEAK